MVALRLLPILALAGSLLVACGGEEAGEDGPAGAERLEHVHGLGVNPGDGALYIATHSGLFRAAAGSERVEPVGEGRQDTMGFTVTGPDRFLASGHPGPGEDGPPNLGLVESTDGGETWEEVSLGGEADFHALVWEHGRVYGYDASHGRLMSSDDRGRTWEERAVPAPVIDLAVDPDDAQRLLISTEAGLMVSDRGGERWRPIGDEVGIGLLAWPAGERLYLVDARGGAHVSRDGGRRWEDAGQIGGQPAALVATGPRELYAALPEGTVMRSTDAGESWSVRARP